MVGARATTYRSFLNEYIHWNVDTTRSGRRSIEQLVAPLITRLPSEKAQQQGRGGVSQAGIMTQRCIAQGVPI